MNKIVLLCLLLLGVSFSSFCQPICPDSEIEKVHLVFKTHLDIGFTDLGSNVLNAYMEEFIPSVLSLTEGIHEHKDLNRYIWTTGSWLLWNYLDKASTYNRKRMEDAIGRNDFFWNASPFTFEAEVCDSALIEAAFYTSKQLDKRFSRKTISMKQTDVPGITRSVIPFLERNGIKLLFIGTNPCVPQPGIPEVFRWRHPDGSEVCVVYKIGYGESLKIPGTKIAGVLAFTGDNHGAHTPKEIQEIYDGLHKKYPKAQIVASSLDSIAGIIDQIKSKLPVVTSEMGDSWIWGIGSDPKKIAELRELMRLRRKWLKNGKLEHGSDLDMNYSMSLLLVSEHTWGLDVKWNLNDWDKYQPVEFNKLINTPKYKRMELSWREKQAYIYDALAKLPADLQREAIDSLENLKPVHPIFHNFKKLTVDSKWIKAGQFEVIFDKITGGIKKLKNSSTGTIIVDGKLPFGEVAYQTFSEQVFKKFIDDYCPPNPSESVTMDYGKRGLEQSTGLAHATYVYQLNQSYIKLNGQGTAITLKLSGGSIDLTSPQYGAPREVYLEYYFPDKGDITLSITWFGKQNTRIPDATWISFCPAYTNPKLFIEKLGSEIDVTDVMENGSRHFHAIGDYVRFKERNHELRIESLDASLIALNKRDLMYFNNDSVNPAQGIHYCLHNNCWGTNYRQWFNYDMKYRFVFHSS